MIELFKEWFAWNYKRFTWGYEFFQKFIALFNFVGIVALLFRGIDYTISRWLLLPLLLLGGCLFCLCVGWFMFDIMRFKTRFTRMEGDRDDYWHRLLTPKEQKMLLLYLDAVRNPNKQGELRKRVASGKL